MAAWAWGCGPACEPVIPSIDLPFLGPPLQAPANEVGLRALRALTLERAATRVPIVAGEPVVVQVQLPARHCAGELALRVAQSVGPSDPPADITLSLVEGAGASGTVLGTSDALRRTDDGVVLDTYAELAAEKRLGPSATDHSLTFAVDEGVDLVTLVRTSAEARESGVLAATFTTAPRKP